MELGLSVVARLDVCEVAGPYLRMLVAQTGETAHMGVLRGGEVVSLINVESGQTLRTPSTVGARTPAHCTSLGKAILAFATQESLDLFLQNQTLKSYTPKTITSSLRFKTELSTIRECGYSVDNEEREEGLRCIGAPVYDRSNEVIAAIGIAGPVFRITDQRLAMCSAAVMNTAGKISAALGHRTMRGRR
jgi:IclR family KDG regulon transcriptional repressor